MKILPVIVIVGTLPLLAGIGASSDELFEGTRVRDFAHRGAPELHMPTDVAVGADGRVYVADGVNDRVLVFDSTGALVAELSAFGDDTLSRPLAVATDGPGRVYVADTGNQRIVVWNAQDGFERAILAPPTTDSRATDITGLAVDRDGRTLWVADNDHDRVLRLDIATETWREFGASGGSLGQFSYPFFLAVTANGDILITDVLNARVQMINDQGVPVRAIGTYGLRAGQLYRPKGVAVDSDGLAWVSDSVMGVVQIFSQESGFVGVLRDAKGELLRFDEPMGLAFDERGALYVVEFGADRVVKVNISRNLAGAAANAPAARSGTSRRQAKSCTICHLAWMPDFEDAEGETLIPWPDDSSADPLVARGETCRSCHDGSVSDSRRRVWQDHGHRTGVEPPAAMAVPRDFPLIDGKMSCRTCHSAHGPLADMGDLKRAVILRRPNVASELCKSCHADKLGGPRFGTHPTGGLPWAVPAELVDAGARVGPNPRELTCQVCHTPHGARRDHLLVMDASTNQLCLTCHDQMRPGIFRDGSHSEHPLNPLANDEQRAAVDAMGTKLSAEGRLVCLSCHKLHHGRGERFLLADDLNDGQMCLRCHSDRAAMIGSPHDLRTNRPDEVNRLGMTPLTGGPCSACHLFHRYAREITPTPPDMTGKCVTCHSRDQCAEGMSLGSVNHPRETCLSCHNPHEMQYGHFLARENVCIECHADMAALRGGPHDSSMGQSGWTEANIESSAASNVCLNCHRPHGDSQTGLWRCAPANLADADAVCISCHEQAGWDSSHGVAALHPRLANDAAAASGLPLIDVVSNREGDGQVANESARIGCRTCHDPHAGPMSAAHLLRAPHDEGEQLCLQCHDNMRQVVLTSHAPNKLREAGMEAEACGPCHNPHGNPTDAGSAPLWSRDLLAAALESNSVATALVPVEGVYCVGCHRSGGPAPVPQVASHPEAPLFDPTGHLPLGSAAPAQATAGMLSCGTCHLPHGRTTSSGAAEPFTSEERSLLREFAAPNACTACHGAESLARFLYFHDAEKRTLTK